MNSRIKTAIVLAVVAVSATVFVASAAAQMRRINSGARGARPRISARLVGPRLGFAGTPFGGFFPGYSYLPSYYYPGYDYGEYEPSAPPAPAVAPVVVVQSAPPAPVPAQNPVESVVLENRGGQWVRISNNGQIPAEQTPAGAKEPAATTVRPKPTVLVFRDGRNEEIERYMIKGDFIYVGVNYWSTGAWTRKIPIAELDVPATQKLNEERGLKFSLPSGPNEVMLRP